MSDDGGAHALRRRLQVALSPDDAIVTDGLFRSLPAFCLAHALAAALVFAFLGPSMGWGRATVWLAAQAAVVALRLGLRHLFRWQRGARPARGWLLAFVAGTIAQACLWAAFPWLVPASALIAAWPLVLLLCISAVAGALAGLAPHLIAFYGFVLPILLSLGLRLLGAGDDTFASAGWLAVVGALLTAAIGYLSHRSLRAAAAASSANLELARRLGDKSAQLEATFESIDQGLVVFGADGRLDTWNSAAARLFDRVGLALAPGLTLAGFGAPADPDTGTFELTHPGGRTIEVRLASMRGGGRVGTLTDVTRTRRAQAEMLHRARHDPLTGLANRTYFHEQLGGLLADAQVRGCAVGLFLLDLDRFKDINDTLGHATGDRLLQAVGRRIADEAGSAGVVARLGGDEFAVLFGDLPDSDRAGGRAEVLVEALRRPIVVDGNELHPGVSVGIALHPRDGADADALLRAADVALYRAKAAGGDAFAFSSPADLRAAAARHRLEHDLLGAMERGEVAVEYQPVVDLRGGAVVALEALVRWRHPDLGMVDTTELVRVAEITGHIRRLGAWVLRTACRQAARWRLDGLPFGRIAVNISAVQFPRQDLPGLVVQTLGETGLPPEALELELTETSVMAPGGPAPAVLARLKALGLGLSLDDFGTGFASLAYLTRFPFGALKIDSAFMTALDDEKNRAIVGSVIELARKLGMRTVAEGVETEAQIGHLRALGCDEIQGFVVSPPVPALEVPALLARLTPQPRPAVVAPATDRRARPRRVAQ